MKIHIIHKIIIFCFLGFNYIPLNAEETWIEINEGKIPASIITSSKFEGYGYVNYLDLKSLVKKKDITYFNWNTRLKSQMEHLLILTLIQVKKEGNKL